MSDSERDARIAALEAAVAELRSEVAHARRPLNGKEVVEIIAPADPERADGPYR